MASKKSTNNVIAMAIIAIILLLGTTGYLWVENNKLKNEIAKYDEELNNLSQTQAKLEKDYELAINSLDDLKGDNQELNSLIEAQKTELKAQKDKISTLIWKTRKLDKAKAEIENLKAQALEYVQEINDLKEQNQVLTSANQRLQKDKSELFSKLNLTESEKAQIQHEKDSLALVKQKLEKDKQKLFTKANKASVIPLDNIVVKGYSIKKSGKYSRKRKAKNIELLKICFDIMENEIADPGDEIFHVRLIGPDGNTLYDENTGSGMISKSSDNSPLKYTKKYIINYTGQKENKCLIWNKDIPLTKGPYKLEIYNKGYLTGKYDFKLR
jgi:myosin heavy subunit